MVGTERRSERILAPTENKFGEGNVAALSVSASDLAESAVHRNLRTGNVGRIR
jgi:hypothetical protein